MNEGARSAANVWVIAHHGKVILRTHLQLEAGRKSQRSDRSPLIPGYYYVKQERVSPSDPSTAQIKVEAITILSRPFQMAAAVSPGQNADATAHGGIW